MSDISDINDFWGKIFKSENNTMTTQILFAFIFIALFSKLIFSSIQSYDDTGSHGSASINIMSFSIILISVLSIVFMNAINNDSLNGILSDPKHSGYLVALTVYLCWMISINVKHYTRINLQQVPSNYFLYSNLSILVIAGQSLFFMIYSFLNNNKEEGLLNSNKDLIKRLDFIHYILIFLNFLLILIQQIILDNFSVDII